jgi:hypothetical protein
MADLKISQLPAATTPLAGTEVLPIVQSGTTVQASVDSVIASRAALAANTFTAAQEWATGTAIASASTINLNTATGNRVHITGTTAITAVTLTRGPRTVIFDGVLTLTHNATTNNLPGGANITTAAGDRAIYESDGTTVYCVSYTKVSGTAVVVAAPTSTIVRSPRTSNTILGVADQSKLIDVTSGTFTQTFSAAATLGDGWFAYVGNSGTGYVTLDPNSSETITVNGVAQTTWVLWPREMGLVICNGSNLFYYCIQKGEITQTISSGVATVAFSTGIAYRRRLSLSIENLSNATAGKLNLQVNSTNGGIGGWFRVNGSTVTGAAADDAGDIGANSNIPDSLTGNQRFAGLALIQPGPVYVSCDFSSTFTTTSGQYCNATGSGYWDTITEATITSIGIANNTGNMATGTFILREL